MLAGKALSASTVAAHRSRSIAMATTARGSLRRATYRVPWSGDKAMGMSVPPNVSTCTVSSVPWAAFSRSTCTSPLSAQETNTRLSWLMGQSAFGSQAHGAGQPQRDRRGCR